jgi:hypothetical protein
MIRFCYIRIPFFVTWIGRKNPATARIFQCLADIFAACYGSYYYFCPKRLFIAPGTRDQRSGIRDQKNNRAQSARILI